MFSPSLLHPWFRDLSTGNPAADVKRSVRSCGLIPAYLRVSKLSRIERELLLQQTGGTSGESWDRGSMVNRAISVMTAVRTRPQDFAWWGIGLLLGIGTVVRVPQLFHSLNEAHAFRQTQTAFVAKKYAQDGINLLITPLPVFGSGSDVPMEFPLFQAVVSITSHLGLSIDFSARLIALVAFQMTALLLAMILLRWHGRAVAVLAVGLFEVIPFGLLWGAASLIDFFAVALSLGMIYCLDRWLSGSSVALLLVGSVAGMLAYLVKATTAPVWSLLLLVPVSMALVRVGWRASWKRVVIALAAGPGLGLVCAVGWTLYADSVKKSEPLTAFLTSSSLRGWNFGTTAQRLDPSTYSAILERVGGEIAGPGLVLLWVGVVAVIFLRSTTQRIAMCGWFLVIASGPLVFINLYYVHSYYLIAIYPAIIAAMAVGIVWTARLLPAVRWQRVAFAIVAVTAIFVGFLLSSGARFDVNLFRHGQPLPAASADIRQGTPSGSRIIMVGCDWSPNYLYYADREGIMFKFPDPGSVWESKNIADYPYAYSCDTKLSPDRWLPDGYSSVSTDTLGLYRVVRNNS